MLQLQLEVSHLLKVIKVLSDELCYFRSFARMEETKMCHIEKELEEVREVEDEMRTLKSDLANAKMELNFYRKKKLLEEEQSKFMHEPLANRIMNSTGKTNILFVVRRCDTSHSSSSLTNTNAQHKFRESTDYVPMRFYY